MALLFGRSWDSLRRHSWLLVIAAMPFVWTFVLLEHTWHHLHFTWRTFVVFAIGLLLYLRHAAHLNHPLALFKGHPKNRPHAGDETPIEL